MGRFRNSTRERSTRPVQIEYTHAASADEATRYNDTDEASKTEGEKKRIPTRILAWSWTHGVLFPNTPAPSFRDPDEMSGRTMVRRRRKVAEWMRRTRGSVEVKLVLVPNQPPTRRETNWPPSFHAPLLGRRPSDRPAVVLLGVATAIDASRRQRSAGAPSLWAVDGSISSSQQRSIATPLPDRIAISQ